MYEAYGGREEANRTNVYWMWTGEQGVKDRKEEAYMPEGLVKASELQHIRTRFCYRGLDFGLWYYYGPVFCDRNGRGLVIGGRI